MLVHWLAQYPADWQRGCRKFQCPAKIESRLPDSLWLALTTDREPWVRSDPLKKMSIWLVIFCNLELIFCMQYCHSWIAQVEYQGQTQYTRILDSKPFTDTCCHIGNRLELKYLYFAQFLLNAHWAADWPHKVKSQTLKFRTDLWDSVMLWMVGQ